MKNGLILIFCVILAISCKKDEGVDNNNPYLINPLVNINLNLNLPAYNSLKFPGNSLIVTQQGIRGIVIYNVNNTLYTAFELSDPNHAPNSCSTMTIEGIIASCPCSSDTNSYDIVTGQHENDPSKFPMQQYRAERIGDNLHITN